MPATVKRIPEVKPEVTPVAEVKIDLSRCDFQNPESKRQCILTKDEHAAHPDWTHKFRDTKTAKTVKMPDTSKLKGFKMEAVPVAETVQVKETGTRDEWQLQVDKDVFHAHTCWIEGKAVDGSETTFKPRATEFNQSPRGRYKVDPEDVDAIRLLLDRAGRFHNFRVRIAPTVTHGDGQKMIYFVVTDRVERTKKTETVLVNGTVPAATVSQ